MVTTILVVVLTRFAQVWSPTQTVSNIDEANRTVGDYKLRIICDVMTFTGLMGEGELSCQCFSHIE